VLKRAIECFKFLCETASREEGGGTHNFNGNFLAAIQFAAIRRWRTWCTGALTRFILQVDNTGKPMDQVSVH